MSKETSKLGQALRSLNAAQPFRIAPELTFKRPESREAPQVATAWSSRAIDDTGLKTDRVQFSPGQDLTGSNFDPLEKSEPKIELNSHELRSAQSKTDPVKFEQTGSGFTQVPHAVLRVAGLFEDPIDFMVYLHLFTFSWGYQRETVDMGLTQLERFTGAARNTIRRSLERLSERRWITEVQKQEPGRISRKWKVRNPSPKPDGGTGSKIDPVKIRQGQPLTRRGANSDPVTGSKIDPYKESSKQSFKETLSLENEELRKYFDSMSAPRKRESEWRAFRELRVAHSESDIALALTHVQAHGVGEKGEACHSPMAYLAKAIESVIANAHEVREREQLVKSRVQAEEQRKTQAQSQADLEEALTAANIATFEKDFPLEGERTAKIHELTRDLMFIPEPSRRVIAAARWVRG